MTIFWMYFRIYDIKTKWLINIISQKIKIIMSSGIWADTITKDHSIFIPPSMNMNRLRSIGSLSFYTKTDFLFFLLSIVKTQATDVSWCFRRFWVIIESLGGTKNDLGVIKFSFFSSVGIWIFRCKILRVLSYRITVQISYGHISDYHTIIG